MNCISTADHTKAAVLARYATAFTVAKGCAAFTGGRTKTDEGWTSIKVAINAQIEAIYAYQGNMDTKFTEMLTNLDDVKKKQNDMVDGIKAKATNMADFKKEINDFLDIITGPKGMLTKLNCKWIAESIKNVAGAFCYGFVAPLWGFAIFMGCMGCMSCCIVPATFYLNKNFADKRVYMRNMVLPFGYGLGNKSNKLYNRTTRPTPSAKGAKGAQSTAP